MRFNRSKDGAVRATIRVDYRVGLDQLVTAAALVLDRDWQEGDDLIERASKLTKSEIEAELRSRLWANGEEAFLFVGERTYMGHELFSAAEEDCVGRVRELWPELTP